MTFTTPFLLVAVLVLPLVWRLLRVTPPAPRRQLFPAVRLLFGLNTPEDSAARTPPWLLALRLILTTIIILAAAGPVIAPAPPFPGHNPLLLVIDDGWTTARDWPQRQARILDILAAAERASRPVRLLTTAPPVTLGPLATATQARAMVEALDPKPWPTDHAAATSEVKSLTDYNAVWISDGLDDEGGLARALQRVGGGVEIITGEISQILLPEPESQNLTTKIRRFTNLNTPETVFLRASENGTILARQEAAFQPGATETTIRLHLPDELRNRITRLDIDGEHSAATTLLLDEHWRRRPVGLVANGEGAAPLLSPLYYVERALNPVADLHTGELGTLLASKVSVLILADMTAPSSTRLESWIRQGGILVRFAGPVLARTPDSFLPVRLRSGGRNLGGIMSWNTAQTLGTFAADGPFAGLTAPSDVTVTAQVLSDPSPAPVWASLADGTPLVTAERRGQGWVVLVHTTANAEWSTLALSGLFPEMLHRLVMLGQGLPGNGRGLPPVQIMDGFGVLHAPAGTVTAITGTAITGTAITGDPIPGPSHPPGLYGQGGAVQAVNLGPSLGNPGLLKAPSGATIIPLNGHQDEIDLRGPLLALALVLIMVDLLASLALRGVLAVVLVLVIAPAKAEDSFALEAGLQSRLAYVRTGDGETDSKSKAGLTTLSLMVGERSTADLSPPMDVDPETDPILFFPLVYWPVLPNAKPLSPAALDKVQTYMHRGGLIVFDLADSSLPLPQGLPPLMPIPADHVLNRAFYLLKGMPGRNEGGTVWVESTGSAADTNDGVSSVVVGSADWAGAWAQDHQGRPLYATLPGGEVQREGAWRVGVNLVMYALTGNYKSDQVHLPAILQRLGR